ncbi:Predicted transcriptional regulator, RBAM029680 [Thermobacillus xylanilyticus]|jgi:DNA-binding transcriptional MerR regulator|uniref:Predicted transcriptional regulator, RBAM029680 n=2 Tax=Thermobacillus TaxID=76632 RepID=A0ABM8V747_THEXY|nr:MULTISPECIES: MerR family transcriptional regulator [Thermobacillus]AGA58930.1 putative transcriptional regulator [Thermobacillus composti KWC4]CAG5091074.1 Predicted transcriptional regulator, RBAM029680 [Thermobacillus xylanilyticus]
MRIKDVMRLTGLTRKAIYYYEEAGLIAPAVDPDNQYRTYSREDVERLRYIRLLRSLGMPIPDIRDLIRHPDRAAGLLRKRLAETETEAAELNQRRSALLVLIEAAEQSPDDGGKSRLDEAGRFVAAAEEERKRRGDYMRRKLLELFPGAMGKFMALHFGAFLDGPLEGADKEAAWDRLVDYVDSMESFEIPEPMAGQINQLDDSEFEEIAAAYREMQQRYIAPTEAEYEKLKEELKQQAEFFRSWPDGRMQAENARQLKESLDRAGFFTVFIGQMRVLSPEYTSYLETLDRLQRDTGIRYEDHGALVF